MWFHREGPPPKKEQVLSSKDGNEKNFQAQRKLVEVGLSHGILVYSHGDPTGWCQYGSRDEFPQVDNATKYRAVLPMDVNRKLWRITCGQAVSCR